MLGSDVQGWLPLLKSSVTPSVWAQGYQIRSIFQKETGNPDSYVACHF